MIGIIAKKKERDIVKEFFELFKTPWEFCQLNRSYQVVICTKDCPLEINAELLLIYSSDKIKFDFENEIKIISYKEGTLLKYIENYLPIYGEISTFKINTTPLVIVKNTNNPAVIKIEGKDQKIFRIGYNLFQEVCFLLSSGQPIENAQIPTLEIHISMLRDFILNSGIPLIEIPPVPPRYNFITCLTHDVDFFSIRKHKFDLTIFGFIYRALFVSLINFLKGKSSLKKLLKNCKAVLLLPAIYLKLSKDLWIQFDRYIEIEKGLASTFFIIPFKNQSGGNISGQTSKKRSVRYDINDIKLDVKHLIINGCEIGVHGIDAWYDSAKAHEEFNRVFLVSGKSDIGIRMHWLYFNDSSPQILDKEDFLYDSTLGYNDAVGYITGTTQIFRPLSAKNLLEIPLNFQDTALFFPKRMNLTEKKALDLAKELLNNSKKYGGVITINWHHRSIAPERLWDDFYLKLLKELKRHNPWFATAKDAVNWFSRRRKILFLEEKVTQNSIKVKLKGDLPNQKPGMMLRIYKPNGMESCSLFSSQYSKPNYFDILLENKMDFQFTF